MILRLLIVLEKATGMQAITRPLHLFHARSDGGIIRRATVDDNEEPIVMAGASTGLFWSGAWSNVTAFTH
jgi:hypothetical protein